MHLVYLSLFMKVCSVAAQQDYHRLRSGFELLSTGPGVGAKFKVIPPVFTDPAAKIAELQEVAFAQRLFDQAVQLEPLIGKPGTQVNLGFWSGIRSTGSNHGSLVCLLDAVNSFNSDSSQVGPQLPERAIWDEGASSSDQYPLYVLQISEVRKL